MAVSTVGRVAGPAPGFPSTPSGRPELNTPIPGRPSASRNLEPEELERIACVAVGRAIRCLRTRLHITQEELGFRADMHRNYVGHVERGEGNPSMRVIAKLVHGLALPTNIVAVEFVRSIKAEIANAKATRS